MQFSGLSLDQAPPFWSVARFFLSVPLFIILAGLFILSNVPLYFLELQSIQTITLVHIFTLGVFSMSMLGALQQMLPVIASVSIQKNRFVATFTHLFLTLGTLGFTINFWFSNTLLFTLTVILLFMAFSISIGALLLALLRVHSHTPTTKGVFIALLFAALAIFLGLSLLDGYQEINFSSTFNATLIHALLALFGFAGILIISVSFQIIPMFYTSPHYKHFCKRYVLPIIALGLLTTALLIVMHSPFFTYALALTLLFFLAFATATLYKFKNRRRKVHDTTVSFWMLAVISLFIGGTLLILELLFTLNSYAYIGVLLLVGFLLSTINAMLYKILPFLVWFHLSSRGHFEIPTIREIINEKSTTIQFAIHLVTLMTFLLSFTFPILFYGVALGFIFSGGIIFFNLFHAVLIYKKWDKVASPMETFS